MTAKELGDRENSVFNMSTLNPRFKKYRKGLQSGLSSRATQNYLPLIYQERHVLLKGLLTTPQDFISHVRRYSTFFNVSFY
jgi:cytochrome P450